MTTKDTLILYHFYERDETYKVNLITFLAVGTKVDCDIIVSISGETSVSLPEIPNVEYKFVENTGSEVETVIDGMQTATDGGYKYCIVINSSCRGPFLIGHADADWTRLFTDYLDAGYSLVGSSICFPDWKAKFYLQLGIENSQHYSEMHVQTYAYSIKVDLIRKLLSTDFFHKIGMSRGRLSLIESYEIQLSSNVLKLGGRIAAFVPPFRSDEIVTAAKCYSVGGDYIYSRTIYNQSIHPYQILFLKTNRGVISSRELDVVTLELLDARCRSDLLNNIEVITLQEKLFYDVNSIRVRFTHGLIRKLQRLGRGILNILRVINHK